MWRTRSESGMEAWSPSRLWSSWGSLIGSLMSNMGTRIHQSTTALNNAWQHGMQ